MPGMELTASDWKLWQGSPFGVQAFRSANLSPPTAFYPIRRKGTITELFSVSAGGWTQKMGFRAPPSGWVVANVGAA